MRKLIYIIFFFSFIGQAQDPWNMWLQASLEQATPSCTPLANNYHTTANAASDSNCNEDNSTTGWVNVNPSNASLVSSASDVVVGDYAFEATLNVDNGGSSITFSFTAVSGDQFDVIYWAKDNTTVNTTRSRFWSGVVSGPDHTFAETWTEYTDSVEANATTVTIVFWLNLTTGDVGDKLWLDDLRIVKTN